MIRRFELHRDEDVSGISGTGVVAEGAILSSGKAVIEWLTEWPTSVVWHDRGLESVEHVHGHSGRTRIVWVDPPEGVLGVTRVLTEADVEDIKRRWEELAAVDLTPDKAALVQRVVGAETTGPLTWDVHDERVWDGLEADAAERMARPIETPTEGLS